ncbi:DUF928 domain-containing protein [Limnoraphis robusta]|uniref:DUF928 domain-containing protein n=1 Tax=Limnoraphis robusta CS-951 TaxID=1637645 RepID=A0A0F5YJY7_9CYAN|nr:DUF928 domain-containing protein [Limnoraphis robusta]KKD39191.1 hypothetical protein WN50_04755 [Limnoraphis robusta CS-951]
MRFKVIGAIALLCITGLETEVRANTSIQLSQFRPADTTKPAYRGGGVSRGGSVFEGGSSLIALTPVRGGVTIAEYPTLLVYVPQPEESLTNSPVEMGLKDEEDHVIYKTIIQLPPQESIIAINLKQDETSISLEPNKTYRWYIYSTRIDSDYIEVPITRIRPDEELSQALEKANLQERFNLYNQNGIWYEALLALFELRRANPNDITLIQEWKELLHFVEIEKIADVPLLLIEAPTSQNKTPDSLEISEPNPMPNPMPNRVKSDTELTSPFRPPEQRIPHGPDGGSR